MSAPRVVALAGGVGASRFLRGLVRATEPEGITAIVNTGDDREFYGVYVAPDLDIVTYALAEQIDPERGYGLEGDTHHVVDTLAARGHEAWFRLGDRDFANCLHRTLRMRAGDGLAATADQLRRHLGVVPVLLPMSEDPCPTYVELEGGRRVHFEDYLARDGAPDEVTRVDLSAAEVARPGPGVCEALRSAEFILLCPSNPVVSIAPILSVPGVREAIAASEAPVVGVSPIVGGAPIKGPADRLLRGIGVEVSALGVAQLYGELLDGFVIDQRDANLAAPIEALGLRVIVTETLMRSVDVARDLAVQVLTLAEACRA